MLPCSLLQRKEAMSITTWYYLITVYNCSSFYFASVFSATHLMDLMQYHGGTNFDRLASAFITTAYYDEAPLDEYGMFSPFST
jgi:hypothetical protein